MRQRNRIAATAWVVGATMALAARAVGADPQPERLEALDARLEQLLEQNAQMQREIQRLTREVEALRGEATPQPAADATPPPSAAEAPPAAPPPPVTAQAPPAPAEAEPALLAKRIGGAQVRLADLSLDVLAAVGGSSARDDEIELLQGGGHDPRQRGFTFQQAELSFLGAVDPYLNAEAHLIYFIDTDGESRFEIEEAFLQSVALPFDLDAQGIQLEAGSFFTEFGRQNPLHPHAWDFQDQPFVLTRFFGEDGIRGPGLRLGWLLPLPWSSELHLGVQNAKGETMTSFLASDEVFEERAIGGRPFVDRGVHRLGDLVYLLRSTHGVDLSDEISAQLGASALFGPNASGKDGETRIYGGDVVVKWRPLDAERGWPFLKLEGEILYRAYRADAFLGCFEPGIACTVVALPRDTLEDFGGYVQGLWGFRRGLSAGLRYEYGSGSGSNLGFDPDLDAAIRVSRGTDPFRAARHRISPLLAFHPSEFARIRLQYDYDRQRFLDRHDQHSIWAGVEFMLGAHPAHGY